MESSILPPWTELAGQSAALSVRLEKMAESVNTISSIISNNNWNLLCFQREFQSPLFDLAYETIISKLLQASDSLGHVWSGLQNTSVLNGRCVKQSACVCLNNAISSVETSVNTQYQRDKQFLEEDFEDMINYVFYRTSEKA
jgi:hypothetical protein